MLDRFPSICSGRECQRVAIARVVINKPKVIIADEPPGNLDSENSKVILSLLSDLNKAGIAIILVTHGSAVASFLIGYCI